MFWEMQERAGGALSPRRVRWGRDVASRRGRQKCSVFVRLSVTLLNGKVCRNDFAQKGLKLKRDFDVVG